MKIMGWTAHAAGTFHALGNFEGGFHNLEKDLSIHER
jgi:hypothetical protein